MTTIGTRLPRSTGQGHKQTCRVTVGKRHCRNRGSDINEVGISEVIGTSKKRPIYSMVDDGDDNTTVFKYVENFRFNFKHYLRNINQRKLS